MKKLLLIFLLFLFHSGVSFGDGFYFANAIPTPSGDTCTGELVFSTHFEGVGNSTTPFDVTTGDPAGCNSNADKTIDYSSDAVNTTAWSTDGAYSFYRAGPNDVAHIALDPQAVDGSISIEFDFRFSNFLDTQIIENFTDGLSNSYLKILMDGTDEIKVVGYINGTTVNGSLTTSGWDLAPNTWYRIRIRTRVGSTDPWAEVTLDGTQDVTDNDDVANRINTLVNCYLGTSTVQAGVFNIDNFQVYNTWKTGDEWGD